MSSFVASIVVTVVSYVIQQQAADDAREAAQRAQQEAQARAAAQQAAMDAAADAAKGTKVVIASESVSLRVVYGRALVGGVRVYHTTFNSYTTKGISTGGQLFQSGTSLDSNISGSKHEFLMAQQAICMGGINGAYAISLDDRNLNGDYVNEYNDVIYEASERFANGVSGALKTGVTLIDPYTHGARLHIYPDGNIADELATANDATRSTALFTKTAYATGIYRYNRDDPQFGGVPSAQFYVEGMKIRGIGTTGENPSGYGISFTRNYSNNPALVLLDYLIDTTYGRGLAIVNTGTSYNCPEINLGSFYRAAQVCERVVMTVPLEGALWRNKGGTRNVKLYECNIALDTSKPLRDNIEIILNTMGDAQLVWSAGQYSLKLNYPTIWGTNGISITQVFPVTTTVTTILPTTTVAPVNQPDVFIDPTGIFGGISTFFGIDILSVFGVAFTAAVAQVVETPPTYITSTTPASTLTSYIPYNFGDVVQFTTDSGPRLFRSKVSNNVALPTNTTYWEDIISADISDNDIIREGQTSISWPNAGTRFNYCVIRYLNEAKDFKEDNVFWPPKTESVYAAYLAQDSGLPLELEMFAEGCTSSYHARALAEQKVRSSRTGVTYSFSLNHEFIHLEPGDFLQINSDILNIPGELVKITELKPEATGVIRVSAYKYDANDLAWNVADNELSPIRNIFISDVTSVAVGDIVFVDDGFNGYITWPALTDNRVIGYQILTAAVNAGVSTEWIGRGTVTATRYDFPDLYSTDYYVTIVPVTYDDRKPSIINWPIKFIPYSLPAAVTGLTAAFTEAGVRVNWNAVASPRISQYELRENGASWETSDYICTVKTTEVQQPPLLASTHVYRIKSIDINGRYSLNETTFSRIVNTPAAVELTNQVIDNNVLLMWTASLSNQPIRTHEIRRGDTYATSTYIGEKSGLFTTVFEINGGIFKYWVTAIDIGGNCSEPASTVAVVAAPRDYSLRNEIDSSLQDETYIDVTDSGVTPSNYYVDLSYYNEVYCYTDFTLVNGSWHQEIFDLGEGSSLDIPLSTALVTLNTAVITPTPIVTVYISGSLDGSSWSTAINGTSAGLYNFRYVKVRIEVTGTGVVELKALKLQLSSTTIKEAGNIACVSTDSGGTMVTFANAFVDISSITVNANATTPVIAIYDFTDVPNPTSFKILLFDLAGARVSGNASYQITGVI